MSAKDIFPGSPYNIQDTTENESLKMMTGSPKTRTKVSLPRKLFLSLWYGGTVRRNCMALIFCAAVMVVMFYRGSIFNIPGRITAALAPNRPPPSREVRPSLPSSPVKELPVLEHRLTEQKVVEAKNDEEENEKEEEANGKEEKEEKGKKELTKLEEKDEEKEEEKKEEGKGKEEKAKKEEVKSEEPEKKEQERKEGKKEVEETTKEQQNKAQSKELKEERDKEGETSKKEKDKKEEPQGKEKEGKEEEREKQKDQKPTIEKQKQTAVAQEKQETGDKGRKPAVSTFTAEAEGFKIGGKSIRILSGAIHYFRVPPEYWFDRLKKLKACGLNTVETYVPWNLHEENPESYCFTDNIDLLKFLKLAKELGLYVILRPGPYICSEWELGGLPAWLLRDPKMTPRKNYANYTAAVERYFKVLIPKILPYQFSEGGPIIMVQVENEYGHYNKDPDHMVWLRDLMKKLGIKEMLFTSDSTNDLERRGRIAGELMTVNGQTFMGRSLARLKELQPNKPLMVAEFWTGWFDHWGENHHTVSTEEYVRRLGTILKMNASVNFYMFHGGTNFGFLNGANYASTSGLFRHTITSYDYDAPLSENGEMTQKYYATCKAIAEHANTGYEYKEENFEPLKQSLPEPKEYGTFQVKEYATLIDALPLMKPHTISHLVPMEEICVSLTKTTTSDTCKDYNFGFVVYRTQAHGVKKLELKDIKIADRAQLIINGKVSATVEESRTGEFEKKQFELSADKTDLIILVENQGRVNFGRNTDRKGVLEGTITFDEKPIAEWEVFSLDLKPEFVEKLTNKSSIWKKFDKDTQSEAYPPSFYKIPLKKVLVPENLQQNQFPPDTFLNFEGWSRGAALVNGFNLGRYDKRGPQETLFLPGPHLMPQKGQKSLPVAELIMFETTEYHKEIKLQAKAELG